MQQLVNIDVRAVAMAMHMVGAAAPDINSCGKLKDMYTGTYRTCTDGTHPTYAWPL